MTAPDGRPLQAISETMLAPFPPREGDPVFRTVGTFHGNWGESGGWYVETPRTTAPVNPGRATARPA